MDELQAFERFEGIRKHEAEDGEIWYVVVDVIEVLIDSADPSNYWYAMRQRDQSGELSTICGKFPIMHRSNGRRYKMDCANREGILQIIQLIPSPKAEPFRRWLAMLGDQRLDDYADNRLEMERDRLRLLGFSTKQIETHLGQFRKRNALTAEWDRRGVKSGDEQQTLVDEIHKGTFEGMTTEEHAKYKGVDEGVYDHMTDIELAFAIIGDDATLREIEAEDPEGFEGNEKTAKRGGEIAGKLRRRYEEETDRPVISDRSPLLEERKGLSDQRNGE